MKKRVSVIMTAVVLVTAAPAYANCKSQVDAATKAQAERDKACAIAAMPLSKKTAKQVKQGDSVCRAKDKVYQAAAKRLHDCAKRNR
ncbi:MAG: hypothetical protein AAGK01_04735 [Pseudomonadota bacterium]